jgi:hypothetical protein
MTSDLARAVKGSPGFLNGFDPCKDPGHSALTASCGQAGSVLAPRKRKRADKVCQTNQIRMGIGNENDQASKGHSVDALACTGDEGRDTLR